MPRARLNSVSSVFVDAPLAWRQPKMHKPYFLLLAALGLSSSAAFAQDIWARGYVFDTAANTGVDVWYGPGNKVTTNGAFARGANVVASSGAFDIAETGSALLRDGRAVTLTATRAASAGAMAAAAARLAGGPFGMAAALAIPALYDWITADNAQNIRVNSTRTGVEKKDLTKCSVNCYEFKGQTLYFASPSDACIDTQTWWNANNGSYYTLSNSRVTGTYPVMTCFQDNLYTSNGNFAYTQSVALGRRARAADAVSWLPATMDDIAPYMTPRLPSLEFPKQIVDAGGEIDVTSKSITGPSPALVDFAPHVVTTQYPSPADQSFTSQAAGNPYGLSPSTPTQTGSSTGSASVSPGSRVTSGGPLPAGSASPVSPSITSPSTTTNISNYNPTSNTTTTTSTTHVDPQTTSTTISNVTSITNTTNTSTVTNSSTTVTSTTNNTTNVTNTSTDSTPVKANPPAPAPAPVCGVSGLPACQVKVDEVGTPEPYTSAKYKQVGDDYKVQVDAAREKVSSTADKGFLSGWSVFFSAPAVAACQPIVLPNGMGGASMGTLDPCPVVDGVRVVMAYIWALGGFWLCLGMVKRTF